MKFKSMKISLAVTALLIILSAGVLNLNAQNEFPDKSDAIKVDEFKRINNESLAARLDNYAVLISNTPNSVAHIVVYRSLEQHLGTALRSGTHIKGYLTEVRGLESKRIKIINGSIREKLSFEFWLTKSDAASPILTPTIQPPKIDENKAYLFDAFYYSLPGDASNGGCCYLDVYAKEVYEASLSAYAEKLKANPNFKAYIIAYSQPSTLIYFEPHCPECSVELSGSRATQIILNVQTSYLTINKDIDESQVVTLIGGKKESPNIELWLVPKGATPPKPNPLKFSVKQKRK